jgi:hypothetical protein
VEKKQEKKRYFKRFSIDDWVKLSDAKQREHTLFDCKGCHQNYSETQYLFPVRSPRLKSKAKENPFVVSRTLQEQTARQSQLPSKKAIKETAQSFLLSKVCLVG